MERLNLTADKVLMLRYLENFERGNYFAIDSILDDNYRLHILDVKSPLNKSEAIAWMKKIKLAFPHLKITIVVQLADADFVMTRMTLEGTHEEEFNGLPRTNKPVTG